jgi:hypothetical protein
MGQACAETQKRKIFMGGLPFAARIKSGTGRSKGLIFLFLDFLRVLTQPGSDAAIVARAGRSIWQTCYGW